MHRLTRYAFHRESRGANIYRVQACRLAAETVLKLGRPVADIVREQGRTGLEELPGIGSHLSYTIDCLVRTGGFHTLEAGGGHTDSEALFGSLPGVGPQLARQIREQLEIEALEQLKQAACDGRVSRLKVGPKRLQEIRDALAGRFPLRRIPDTVKREPTVADLLAVEQEYRDKAQADKLPTLTPRRFNAGRLRWLPLPRTERSSWHIRALFSDTPLAHQLRHTHDWVVIYCHDAPVSGLRTVVTETRGELRGRHVVRGRERDCRDYYHLLQEAQPPVATGA